MNTTPIFYIKKLNNFIRTNEEALVALYGDDGFKTIQEFQSVLKDIDNAVIKGGMEDLEVIARNNVFVSSVGRILGTKVAAATGGPAYRAVYGTGSFARSGAVPGAYGSGEDARRPAL